MIDSMKINLPLFCTSSILILLVACSTAPQLSTQPLPKSGFLPQYELLKPVTIKDPDVRVWRYSNPVIDSKSYTGVIVEPIFLNQEATQKITPEILNKTKDALQKSMLEGIQTKDHIKVVTKPGPGVAILSVGITGAETSNDSLQPWNFTPIGLAINAAAYTTDMNSKTPAMVIEGKIIDSQSKEIISESLAVIKGESFRTGSGSVESFVEMAKKVVRIALQTAVNP
jgi:hypothetical protein